MEYRLTDERSLYMRAKTVDEEMAALREQHWSAEEAKRVLEACKDSGVAQESASDWLAQQSHSP